MEESKKIKEGEGRSESLKSLMISFTELTKHKKEKALEQAAADQAKKETMELEEAFKKGSKASAIPSVVCVIILN